MKHEVMYPPCRDCADRKISTDPPYICHSDCSKYAAWKEARAEAKHKTSLEEAITFRSKMNILKKLGER